MFFMNEECQALVINMSPDSTWQWAGDIRPPCGLLPRWISWTRGKQTFSNSTLERKRDTPGKELNDTYMIWWHLIWCGPRATYATVDVNESFSYHMYSIPISRNRCPFQACAWQLDVTATRLHDGHGGLTSGCRLICSFGNRSVLAVLIRCFGLIDRGHGPASRC